MACWVASRLFGPELGSDRNELSGGWCWRPRGPEVPSHHLCLLFTPRAQDFHTVEPIRDISSLICDFVKAIKTACSSLLPVADRMSSLSIGMGRTQSSLCVCGLEMTKVPRHFRHVLFWESPRLGSALSASSYCTGVIAQAPLPS